MYLLEMLETFSNNKYMSAYEVSSSSTFVILSIAFASPLKARVIAFLHIYFNW